MCGITGFWTTGATRPLTEAIDGMTDTLDHRGPDDRGTWTDTDHGLALGHRRLAIIDLSTEGAQPMVSASGRYVLVYNGEIYNFAEIKNRLLDRNEGHRFRGGSDTEVFLEAIECFGLERALKYTNGMFAFALWDRSRKELTLARDRLGIKPLYYGAVAGDLIFGSQLACLRAHPRFCTNIDRQALADLLRFNSIPAPRSIYEEVRKLEPGTTITFEEPKKSGRIKRFWNPALVASRGLQNPFQGSAEEAVDALERKLKTAVERRMVADVPLGAFLSGGVDSSTVVALMQDSSARPVKTFSIGFHEQDYNEATDAADVAAHLGTDHSELYVTSDDAISVIPKLPSLYDEPFADSSQIPTFLVSQLARQDVTVSLSGDGGDELFAGYNRHLWAPRIWRTIGAIPRPMRAVLAMAMLQPSPAQLDAIYDRLEGLIPGPARVRLPAEKLQKLAAILAVEQSGDIYRCLRANWRDPGRLVIGLDEDRPIHHTTPVGANFTEKMMFLDLIGYLPDDILTKVDRASMAVGLEARVPLLDHDVVDFAWRLPLNFKIRDGVSKWALRQVLYRHVPRQLIERPKMGFGVPIDKWLRGPLFAWADDLLTPARLHEDGFFRVAPVRKAWREHLQGTANHQHRLWNILTFQAWLDEERRS